MKAELTKTMDYLKSQLNDQAVVTKLTQYISELESERNWAQQEYCRTQSKLEQTDYALENEKKANENNRKALEGFVKENKALRDLVSLWA